MGKNQKKRIIVTKKYKTHQESMTPIKSPNVDTIRDMPLVSTKQGNKKIFIDTKFIHTLFASRPIWAMSSVVNLGSTPWNACTYSTK